MNKKKPTKAQIDACLESVELHLRYEIQQTGIVAVARDIGVSESTVIRRLANMPIMEAGFHKILNWWLARRVRDHAADSLKP